MIYYAKETFLLWWRRYTRIENTKCSFSVIIVQGFLTEHLIVDTVVILVVNNRSDARESLTEDIRPDRVLGSVKWVHVSPTASSSPIAYSSVRSSCYGVKRKSRVSRSRLRTW